MKDWVVSRKLLIHSATLKKVTRTSDNTYFATNTETSSSYTVECNIQPITTKDEAWMSFGGLTVGDAIGYFKPSYQTGTVIVQQNDMLVFSGNTWRIMKVQELYDVKGSVVFIEARMRREIL